ncbi:DNA-binding LacI/PurR family transcriptional regulator [Thermocatellispora tengchongensis]|uniref:DNA-binding LacI/PurR family transcriptional regulator n=1 Tax=Thermocatellispora tengchongensis TaxID=1073253 RepID=A0A840P7E0_9ACTN|nr:LacI family DNA-binding transcriptional regulator [Thermocatellispora tengchongensis]MBB5134919.1 DNA-binding LacI/PurR family transcriptional regulator [Thermocatellispora tengchongensis]
MAKKVTIATVARYAGVSRQTVSNVLNTPEVVREETRRRVHEAVEALGYRANQAARQMRTGRSRLIATRIEPTRDGINGSVLDRFLHGLTEAAAGSGYRVILYTAADDEAEIATYEDLLGAYTPDAFVLASTHHGDARTSWLAARGMPFVTFGRPWDALDAHTWVDVDGAAGTEEATGHLLGSGHRRVAFLGWPEGSGVGDDRRSGWARAMAAAGLDVAGLAYVCEDRVAEAEAAVRGMLGAGEPPTAIVCASDSLALGAFQAARAANPDAPVAVCGFDDTPVARAVGLTSVSQPLEEAAAHCVRLLTRQIAGEDVDGQNTGGQQEDGAAAPERVLLRPSLVVRRSTT